MSRRTLLFLVQVLLVVTVPGCGSSSTAAVHAPSPSPTLSRCDRSTLEGRPLMYPPLVSGKCQADGLNPQTGLFGADPLYTEGGPHNGTSYGDYFDVSAMVKPGVEGPVLVRGRDLLAANHPLVFVTSNSATYAYMAGPVYGTDPDFGAQYTEIVIDISHPLVWKHLMAWHVDYGQYFWRQELRAAGRGVWASVRRSGLYGHNNINEPPPSVDRLGDGPAIFPGGWRRAACTAWRATQHAAAVTPTLSPDAAMLRVSPRPGLLGRLGSSGSKWHFPATNVLARDGAQTLGISLPTSGAIEPGWTALRPRLVLTDRANPGDEDRSQREEHDYAPKRNAITGVGCHVTVEAVYQNAFNRRNDAGWQCLCNVEQAHVLAGFRRVGNGVAR